MNIGTFFIPMGIIYALIIILLFLWLNQTGIFKYLAKVFDDCLFNQKTQRYDIINLARFTSLITLLLIIIGWHIQLNTHRPYISYNEPSEWLVLMLLGFVATGTAIKIWENKTATPEPPKVEINSETTTVNQPFTSSPATTEPPTECPAAKKARLEIEKSDKVPFTLDDEGVTK